MSLKERAAVLAKQKQSKTIKSYETVQPLAEGRFSTTSVVIDPDTGTERVLKRISTRHWTRADVDTLSEKPAQVKVRELFEREAKVLRQLDHPGIPRFIDAFVDGTDLCLVQEKIEGEPLSDVMKNRRFTEAESISIIKQIADVLAYLHSLHPPLVHRDLKPSNIIVRPDGSIALIDFGAVVDTLAPDGGSTIVGTFGYMPLEQYEGRATPASDIYALGMVWIEILTGKKPSALERDGLTLDFARYTTASTRTKALLAKMVDMDQSQRPATGGVLVGILSTKPKPQTQHVVQPVVSARHETAPREVGWGSMAAVMAAIAIVAGVAFTFADSGTWFGGWWWWIGGFWMLRFLLRGRGTGTRRRYAPRRRQEAVL